MIWIWFVLASSLFNVWVAFTMKTENHRSTFVFKIIPFFSGLGGLIYFLQFKGLI